MVKDENLEKQFEKQMGCMAGFFQIFDRHQIVTGKRLHGHKRLPHSKVVDDEESSEMSGSSTPAISRELVKPAVVTQHVKKSLGKEIPPPKSPHRLSVFELKEEIRSSWRFAKETPRLSLDSRAIVDSKGSVHPREIRTNASILTGNRSESSVAAAVGDGGDDKQRRSPSVIARLMGIEQLPERNPESENAQLRRSASESRVAQDLFNNRSFDNAGNSQLQSHSDFVMQNFKAAAINQTKSSYPSNVTRSTNAMESNSFRNFNEHPKAVNRGLATAQWKSQQHRKSFFDTADVFPEPKQTMSAYADIEKKLKVRGIDEPSKDLESLKQILEALQLKGLLHSNSTPPEHRNFIYDRNFRNEGSPMSVMKQSQSPTGRRLGSNSSISKTTVRRNLNEKLSTVTVSPRRDRPPPQSDRNGRSPTKTLNSATHSDSNGRRNNNCIVKTKTLSVETHRRRNESSDSRRTSPVQSPRTKSPIDHAVMSKSPRNKRSTAEKHHHKEKITTVVTEDESSSISESTFSTSSQPDTERWKPEDLREGKNLLERCDKLLQSISDMNANEMQPSPVSVLDLYKEDSFSSLSPVPKHTIDFQDLSGDLEEEWWSSIFQPDQSSILLEDEHNQDSDYVYILQILRAYDQFPEDSDIYYILEKQQYLKGNDLSKASVLNRRVIFDIITEIIESNKKLPPWKAFQWTDPLSSKPLLQKIWAEFKRIRGGDRKAVEEDIFELVCGVLEKDLASCGGGNGGWDDFRAELSEVVLDIERLIFKDLIGETISELAQYPWRSPAAAAASRRKLVF